MEKLVHQILGMEYGFLTKTIRQKHMNSGNCLKREMHLSVQLIFLYLKNRHDIHNSFLKISLDHTQIEFTMDLSVLIKTTQM